MNENAFWKYYRDFNLYNLVFSAISGIYFGLFNGLFNFLTFGMFIGYLGYNYFRRDEYYLYYNLGFTKRSLVKKVWICNLIIAGPVILIVLLLS